MVWHNSSLYMDALPSSLLRVCLILAFLPYQLSFLFSFTSYLNTSPFFVIGTNSLTLMLRSFASYPTYLLHFDSYITLHPLVWDGPWISLHLALVVQEQWSWLPVHLECVRIVYCGVWWAVLQYSMSFLLFHTCENDLTFSILDIQICFIEIFSCCQVSVCC